MSRIRLKKADRLQAAIQVAIVYQAHRVRILANGGHFAPLPEQKHIIAGAIENMLNRQGIDVDGQNWVHLICQPHWDAVVTTAQALLDGEHWQDIKEGTPCHVSG